MKNGGQRRRRRRSTLTNESLPFELWDQEIFLNALDFSQESDDEISNNNKTMENESIVNFIDRRKNYMLDLMVQPYSCLVIRILQIWNFDLERIKSLDQNQILLDVNNALLKGSVDYILIYINF